MSEWRPFDPSSDALPMLIQEDVMARINGKTFKCSCGCNVFRHPRGEPLVFICNACEARWIGES